jgi:hypothetical protein
MMLRFVFGLVFAAGYGILVYDLVTIGRQRGDAVKVSP